MQETDLLKKSIETKERELLALQEKLDAREKVSPLSLSHSFCIEIYMNLSVTRSLWMTVFLV